jgi:excisionase family DNA binding protein
MDLKLIQAKDIKAIRSELKALHQNTDEWLCCEEAIKFLRISKRTMFRYRISGKLAFSKNGRKIYFKKSDLSELLDNYYNSLI